MASFFHASEPTLNSDKGNKAPMKTPVVGDVGSHFCRYVWPVVWSVQVGLFVCTPFATSSCPVENL